MVPDLSVLNNVSSPVVQSDKREVAAGKAARRRSHDGKTVKGASGVGVGRLAESSRSWSLKVSPSGNLSVV